MLHHVCGHDHVNNQFADVLSQRGSSVTDDNSQANMADANIRAGMAGKYLLLGWVKGFDQVTTRLVEHDVEGLPKRH